MKRTIKIHKDRTGTSLFREMASLRIRNKELELQQKKFERGISALNHHMDETIARILRGHANEIKYFESVIEMISKDKIVCHRFTDFKT